MEVDVNYWKNFLGISALLLFLLWDVAWNITKRCRRGVHWFPTEFLVLSGLTLQLLGYLDSQNVNVFGNDERKEVEELFKKQLGIDSSRLTLCVFLAYVLPGMPLAGSAERLANVAALVVSLFFHIATEVYTLQKVGNTSEGGWWFISSSTTLSMGATCLALYLALAILSGKFIRDETTSDISDMYRHIHLGNGGDGDRWKNFKGEMLKLWLTTHAWQKRYALLSPGLTPGVGGILTVCIAVMGAKVACRRSDLVGLELTFYLHCIFILIGWSVILRRWFLALRSKFEVAVALSPFMALGVLFLYIRVALDPRELLEGSYWECLPSKLQRVLIKIRDILNYIIYVISILPLLLFIVVFSILVLFDYFCWCWPRFMLRLCRFADAQDSETQADEEFPHYKEILEGMVLSSGNAGALWGAVSGSFHQVKDRMESSYRTTRSCKELLVLIQRSIAENHSRMEELVGSNADWKGAAVAIIHAMVELREKNGWNSDWKVKDLIRAYKEVRDLLEFADCPQHLEAGPMSFFQFGLTDMDEVMENLLQDNVILDIERSLEITKQRPQTLPLQHVSPSAPDPPTIQREMKSCTFSYSYQGPYDDRLASYRDEGELVTFLGDIIVCCVLKLPDVIVKYGKRWMEDLQEEKLIKACELAAKVSAILDEWKSSGLQRIANVNTII